MRCSTQITAMLLTTGFHLSLFAAAAPLDGQHFAIDLKDGEKVQGNDTIALAAGKGDCLTVAAKYNYEKGDYVATQTAQGMAVTFTLMSEKNGQLVISGTINGDTITGTRTWSKINKKTLVHHDLGTITQEATDVFVRL